MDKRTQREWIRAWIALGVRENLQFKDLAKRSGISRRTLQRWNHVFRRESREPSPQTDEEHAFVRLVERVQGGPTRIEVYLPGEPRLVIDGAAVIRLLARVLRAVEQ
jgi:transcriptional regulator with XRE-family HTH domain